MRAMWHDPCVRRGGVILVTVALAAGCGAAVEREPDLAAPVHAGSASAPVLANVTTTTTTTAPPPPSGPVAVRARSTSAPRPARPRPGLEVVARLIIPRLGLDTPVYEGFTLDVIDHGPGHMPGSALPGRVGNVVIAGHRVTHSRPFRHLDTLQPGDTLTFETATGTYTYAFAGHDVVSPYDVHITGQGAEYKATLFACHPPGSARYRIVAYWNLTSAPESGQPVLG